MKKINTIATILLSSLLLCACNETASDKSSLNEDSSFTSVIETSSSEISKSDEQTGTETGEETGGDTSIFLNKSYTVETQGSKWDSLMSAGTHIFSDQTGDYTKIVEKFKTYLNKNGEEDTGLVSSLSGADVNSSKCKELSEVNALVIGNSSSSMGELTLNFSRPIFKIELEVESFYKTYSYNNGKSIDKYSVLAIGDSTNSKMKVLDMSMKSNGEDYLPIKLNESLEFVDGISTLTFKGVGDELFDEGASFSPGRTIFNYLTFFY